MSVILNYKNKKKMVTKINDAMLQLTDYTEDCSTDNKKYNHF